MDFFILFYNIRTSRYTIFNPKENKSNSLQYNAGKALINTINITPVRVLDAKELNEKRKRAIEDYNLGLYSIR